MKRNPQFDPDFTNSITVSKLAAAEEHIKAAVRLYLAGDHLVPVFTLAKAAREICRDAWREGGSPYSPKPIGSPRGYDGKGNGERSEPRRGLLRHARSPAGSVEIHEENGCCHLAACLSRLWELD
jgi:hypothetical protein